MNMICTNIVLVYVPELVVLHGNYIDRYCTSIDSCRSQFQARLHLLSTYLGRYM